MLMRKLIIGRVFICQDGSMGSRVNSKWLVQLLRYNIIKKRRVIDECQLPDFIDNLSGKLETVLNDGSHPLHEEFSVN